MLSKKEDIVCNSGRGAAKKVRDTCLFFAEMLQSQGIIEVTVGVIFCSILHMENSNFKPWADWSS